MKVPEEDGQVEEVPMAAVEEAGEKWEARVKVVSVGLVEFRAKTAATAAFRFHQYRSH